MGTSSNNDKESNVLYMVPEHNAKFREQEDHIVLLEPKFKMKFLKKHLMPRMKSPYYKIHLDDFGSFVWKEIDGQKTVMDIAEKLQNEFGESVDPVYERLGLFINMLAQRKYISLTER